jgi:hypothetical protein
VISSESKNTVERFRSYIDRFISLAADYKLDGNGKLVSLWRARRDPEFRRRANIIWGDLVARDGAVLTLPTVLGILGAVLGGIGIAGFGGAIGIPIALLLVPAGILAGLELDSEHVTQKLVRPVRADIVKSPCEGGEGVPDSLQLLVLLSGTSARVDALEETRDSHSTRMDALEEEARRHSVGIEGLERNHQTHTNRIGVLEDARHVHSKELDQLRKSLGSLAQEARSLRRIALLVGASSSTIAVLALALAAFSLLTR